MDRDGGGSLLGGCVPQNGNCAYDCEREREKESWKKKEEGSLKEKQSYLKGVSNRNVFVVICWGICTRVCNFLSAEYFFLDRTFFGNKRFIRVENRGYIIIRTRPLCDKF